MKHLYMFILIYSNICVFVDSLSCALRHVESAPRLASKYVSAPALFKGRKFDLRYYVIVLSLVPLRMYRHQMFVIRVANYPYTTTDLEQFQKHFTVMNFIDDSSCPEEDSVRCAYFYSYLFFAFMYMLL
jgi:hypothetical protein